MDPRQPPTSIMRSRIARANWGQAPKSAVVNPVVVMMETTWKADFRSAGREWTSAPNQRATPMARMPRPTKER